MLIRLQKYMSERGICSRRRAEQFIVSGKIKVNGIIVTTLGTKVDTDNDVVTYHNDVVRNPDRLHYIMLHKPAGIVTSCSQPGAPTVVDLVKIKDRVYPVGRLDKDSTGLLLLTNDGDLAFRLMHPRFQHEKEYIVDTVDPITEGALQKLRQGMRLTDARTQPAKVFKLALRRFRIVLREGRNRQIRRMCQKVGNEVKRLKRIRIENIVIGSLPMGAWRVLTGEEKEVLFERIGLAGQTRPAAQEPTRKPGQARKTNQTRAAEHGPTRKPGQARKTNQTRAAEHGPTRKPGQARKTNQTRAAEHGPTRKPGQTRKPKQTRAAEHGPTRKPGQTRKPNQTRRSRSR